jgi:uncharacterized protein YecT (DUF1311 family)
VVFVGASACAAVVASVAVAPAGGAVRARGVKLSPPVIRETFTPLPCKGKPNSRTTIEQLGCAEQQILKSDKKIDALSASIFSRLHDDAARRRFIAGAKAWLAYRRADCASRSDIFEGGTQAPVVAAQCQSLRNATRIKDLATFKSDLTPRG